MTKGNQTDYQTMYPKSWSLKVHGLPLVCPMLMTPLCWNIPIKVLREKRRWEKNFPSIWAYCFEVKKRLHDPFLATPLHDDRYIYQIKKVHHQKRILNTELGSWVDFNAFVPWYPPPAVFLVVFKVSLDFCFLVSFPIQNFPTHLLFDSIFSLLALFDP